MPTITGIDIHACPVCRRGRMILQHTLIMHKGELRDITTLRNRRSLYQYIKMSILHKTKYHKNYTFFRVKLSKPCLGYAMKKIKITCLKATQKDTTPPKDI